jgi:hypothetical protein
VSFDAKEWDKVKYDLTVFRDQLLVPVNSISFWIRIQSKPQAYLSPYHVLRFFWRRTPGCDRKKEYALWEVAEVGNPRSMVYRRK